MTKRRIFTSDEVERIVWRFAKEDYTNISLLEKYLARYKNSNLKEELWKKFEGYFENNLSGYPSEEIESICMAFNKKIVFVDEGKNEKVQH